MQWICIIRVTCISTNINIKRNKTNRQHSKDYCEMNLYSQFALVFSIWFHFIILFWMHLVALLPLLPLRSTVGAKCLYTVHNTFRFLHVEKFSKFDLEWFESNEMANTPRVHSVQFEMALEKYFTISIWDFVRMFEPNK